LILAVEDVNTAGGIDGSSLQLLSRDSHSDLALGEAEILSLIYDEQVAYLIGPEENELAGRIVGDIKERNVLNILAGFASPTARRITTRGAWLKLAPSAWEMGCGFAHYARDEGIASANTISSQEDYNVSLSSDFLGIFSSLGGTVKPSVTVQPDTDAYASVVGRVLDFDASRTLLVAYPATAAAVVADWSVSGGASRFFLSPLLHSDVFLLNIPFGALDGAMGMSPTLKLASECDGAETGVAGRVHCDNANAEAFAKHFAARWSGTRPFAAAHFYYDAIVLLAFGLQYSKATRGIIPEAPELRRVIRQLNQPSNPSGSWRQLSRAISQLANGEALRYVGAAKEYEFDEYGSARHRLFDTWTIRRNAFAEKGTYYAYCPPAL
jgi:neutral amino acid transport system substrate-binding protein